MSISEYEDYKKVFSDLKNMDANSMIDLLSRKKCSVYLYIWLKQKYNYIYNYSDLSNQFRFKGAQKQFNEIFKETGGVADHKVASSFGTIFYCLLSNESSMKLHNYIYLKFVLNSHENFVKISKEDNSRKGYIESIILRTFKKYKKNREESNKKNDFKQTKNFIRKELKRLMNNYSGKLFSNKEELKREYIKYKINLKEDMNTISKYLCSGSQIGMFNWFYNIIFDDSDISITRICKVGCYLELKRRYKKLFNHNPIKMNGLSSFDNSLDFLVNLNMEVDGTKRIIECYYKKINKINVLKNIKILKETTKIKKLIISFDGL